LAVTMTANHATVLAGTPFTLTLAVRNDAQSAVTASPVNVVIQLPGGLTVLGSLTTAGQLVTTDGVTWAVGGLAPGSGATLELARDHRVLHDGDFITVADGLQGGLQFTPDADRNSDDGLGGFGFHVQASAGAAASGPLGQGVAVPIHVAAVNDAPVVGDDV